MGWEPSVATCDKYLSERTGCYEWRRVRYLAALHAMQLQDSDTVMDIGAGWTELDVCLRVDGNWRGRYIPVDGGIDGTDLNYWSPTREVEWVVALEILEHLNDPYYLLRQIKPFATKGIVVSTPNPRTTDVLGMDDTHITEIHECELRAEGFAVREESFYGQRNDSLFAVWQPQPWLSRS